MCTHSPVRLTGCQGGDAILDASPMTCCVGCSAASTARPVFQLHHTIALTQSLLPRPVSQHDRAMQRPPALFAADIPSSAACTGRVTHVPCIRVSPCGNACTTTAHSTGPAEVQRLCMCVCVMGAVCLCSSLTVGKLFAV
jgi:hypothetical protein